MRSCSSSSEKSIVGSIGARFGPKRLHVEIAGGGPFGPDQPIGAGGLIHRQAARRGDVLWGYAVVHPVEAEVHLVVRKGEVELLLRLLQGIGIRRWLALQDLARNAEISPQLVHLCLVQVRERLE